MGKIKQLQYSEIALKDDDRANALDVLHPDGGTNGGGLPLD